MPITYYTQEDIDTLQEQVYSLQRANIQLVRQLAGKNYALWKQIAEQSTTMTTKELRKYIYNGYKNSLL